LGIIVSNYGLFRFSGERIMNDDKENDPLAAADRDRDRGSSVDPRLRWEDEPTAPPVPTALPWPRASAPQAAPAPSDERTNADLVKVFARTVHKYLIPRGRGGRRFTIILSGVFLLGLVLAMPWGIDCALFSYSQLCSVFDVGREKLGDALMIAPLVIFFIEMAAATELLETFVANVSHHIIGHLLPAGLREHIKDLLKTDFVRSRWFIEYRIAECQKDANVVRVRTLSEYEIENRSGEDKDYDFRYHVEKSWSNAGDAEITHAKAEENNVKLFGYGAGEDEQLIPTVTDSQVQFAKSVRIPMNPHPVFRFVAQSIQFLPLNVEVPFIALVPVLETTVRVLYPKDKFTVLFRLSFPPYNGAVTKNNPAVAVTELEDGTQWVVRKPILPGQSFLTRCIRSGTLRGASAGQAAVGNMSPKV
jgi:hypothetical protein